jgi:hypothetical protein
MTHFKPFSWFRQNRIVVTALLGLFALTGATAFGQDGKAVSESDLLAAIRAFRSEVTDLQGQLAGQNAAAKRPDRKQMAYAEYRSNYDNWSLRVEQCYAKLRGYYEAVDRTYRTNPNSTLYVEIRQAYLDAKTAFDSLNNAFGSYGKPDTMRTVAVVITDGRLSRHITSTVASAKIESKPLVDLSQADEVRYIGKFDAVELYLFVKGTSACYVLYGLRERGTNEKGESVDTIDSRVVFSDSFEIASITNYAPQQHLDQVLKLRLTPVQTQLETWRFITESLAKAKSYAKSPD